MSNRFSTVRQALGIQGGKALTLRQNFAWTLLGDITYAAAQWVAFVAIAKLGTPEMVGLFTLGLAITAPVIIFFNLKLRAVQATDIRQDYQFGDYLTLRLIALGLALAAIFLFVCLSSYSPEAKLAITLIAVTKYFDALSDIMHGFLQLHERMDRISISRMLQGASQLCALSLALWLSHDLTLGLAAWAMASAAITLLYDLPMLRALRDELQARPNAKTTTISPAWHPHKLVKLMQLALPLGIATMLGSLWINVPRYAIQHYAGLSQLGFFSAMTSLMMISGLVMAALGQSASPRLARYHSEGNYKEFDRLITKMVGVSAILAMGGILVAWLAGDLILTAIYTSEYAQYKNVLTILMLAAGIQIIFLFLGAGLQAMREFRFFAPIQGISFFLITALSIGLIPKMGIVGASWAMTASAGMDFFAYLLAFLYTRSKLQKRPDSARSKP